MGENTDVRISYVIVTRNRAEYLEKALANAREFIGPTDELIIVDGNSSDNTSAVIDQNRDLVTLFVSEPDRSEGHAVNKAIARARGRFVKFLTDDDYIYPAGMAKLIELAEENPAIDVFQCGGEVWDCQGDSPVFDGYRGVSADAAKALTPEEFFWQTHHGLGLLVRRDTLLFVGGASAGYVSVDGDLICKLVEADCRLAYVDICLYKWHIFEHSGFRQRAGIAYGSVMFNIRLGNWIGALRQDPKAFATALRTADLRNLDGFLAAVLLLDIVRTSPVGWMLNAFRPLWAAARRLRSKLSLIRKKLRSGAGAGTSGSSPEAARRFTETLVAIPPRSIA
jgi:glycosyltransferase involved in cell wall biosynthesis